MLARVVDAVLGHQHAVAAEIGHALTGHPEVLDDVGDGLQGLIGCEIKRRAAHVPVENHVQVLVGGDALQHPVCDRVVAHLAGIAVADAGGKFLERDVSDRQQEVGLVSRFFLGGGSESLGHVLHPSPLQRHRVNATGDDEIVADRDPVPVLLGRPTAHPRAPSAVEGEDTRPLGGDTRAGCPR